MNINTQILIIDDSKLFWVYLRKSLEVTGIQAEITESPDIASGIQQLKKRSFDCIILDYLLPDGNGLLILQERKALNITTPVVVLTGQGDELVAVNLMKAGAADYLSKSTLSPERLGQSIKNVMYSYQMEKQLKQSEEILKKYQILSDYARDIILFVRSDGQILEANQAAVSAYGYEYDELINMNISAIRQESTQQIAQQLNQASNNGILFETIHYRKDGSFFPVEVSSQGALIGKEHILLSVIRDITKHKQAEKLLKRRLEYEKLIATISFSATTIEILSDFMLLCLDSIGITLDVGRIYVFTYCSKENIYEKSYTWVSPKASGKELEFQRWDFPWFSASMKENLILVLDNTQEIPGQQEKEFVNFLGLKSIILMPLYVNKNYHGFISFCDVNDGKTLPSEDLNILKTIIQILSSILEHKESEKRLRFSEEQYRSIFEASQDVIYITTKEGSFLNINRAGLDLFGYSWDELQNLHVESIYVHPSDRQKLIDNLERNSFVKDYSIIFKKKDGTSIYALITANIRKNENGQIVLQGIIRDITKSKLADEDLREAHAQINHLLGSISSILIGTSSNDRINQWNLAAENCFGISSGEAFGKHLSECGIKWDWTEVQKQLAICKSSNVTVQLENLHYTAIDGRDGLLRLHINPIVDTGGKYWGYVFLGRDITEQKKIESQLMLSQKMESIGQLAAGIAHEINTPMQYIGDNTRFINDSFRDILEVLEKYESILIDEKNHEFNPNFNELKDIAQEIDIEYLKEEIPKSIEQSLEGINRVSKLILAMKEFSHPGKQGKAFSDLNKAIEGTVIISKNEWKYVADLDTRLDPNLPLVYCAIDQINQVVLNMIVNSAQAIKDLVDNGTTSRGKIIIQTEYKDPIVRITLCDTGKGIPRSIIHKVFDHFFTTKEVGKGTGQGLAIAHDIIVNKHHGSIEVNSEEGKGATFIVTLPVNTDESDIGLK